MIVVLKWRNSRVAEEGWIYQPQALGHMGKDVCKVIATKIARVLLIVTSLAETLAYAVLSTIYQK